MAPSFRKIKILPSFISSKKDNIKEQEKQHNDVPIVTHIMSNLDPYSLTFNIITPFTLSIDDEYCPYYTQGFNLLHESRTSKLYGAVYRFYKG